MKPLQVLAVNPQRVLHLPKLLLGHSNLNAVLGKALYGQALNGDVSLALVDLSFCSFEFCLGLRHARDLERA